MSQNTRMYWLQGLTPLHVGAGKGVGFIDMPIMREKVTNWPLVPGSAVKGVMRDYFSVNGTDEQKKYINYAFGQRNSDETSNAGSLVLTDARIVCLPVRSLYGTFAYITSPMVLQRLKKDLEVAGCTHIPNFPVVPSDEVCLHTPGSKIASGDRIFFEDLDFAVTPDNGTTQGWADLLANNLFKGDTTWQKLFKERFGVLSDNCFNFLAQTGTEVSAHIKIDPERKIVAKGALWYEESLPAETILAGIAWCDRVYSNRGPTAEQLAEQLLALYCPVTSLDIQIGGKATVGKGRVRCLFSEFPAGENHA